MGNVFQYNNFLELFSNYCKRVTQLMLFDSLICDYPSMQNYLAPKAEIVNNRIDTPSLGRTLFPEVKPQPLGRKNLTNSLLMSTSHNLLRCEFKF